MYDLENAMWIESKSSFDQVPMITDPEEGLVLANVLKTNVNFLKALAFDVLESKDFIVETLQTHLNEIENGAVFKQDNVFNSITGYTREYKVAEYSKKVHEVISAINDFYWDISEQIDSFVQHTNDNIIDRLIKDPSKANFISFFSELYEMGERIKNKVSTRIKSIVGDEDPLWWRIWELANGLWIFTQEEKDAIESSHQNVKSDILQHIDEKLLLRLWNTTEGIKTFFENLKEEVTNVIELFSDASFNENDFLLEEVIDDSLITMEMIASTGLWKIVDGMHVREEIDS